MRFQNQQAYSADMVRSSDMEKEVYNLSEQHKVPEMAKHKRRARRSV